MYPAEQMEFMRPGGRGLWTEWRWLLGVAGKGNAAGLSIQRHECADTGWPISRILSPANGVAIICLGRWLPNVSSDQPEGSDETGSLFPPIWPCSRRGLPGQTVTRLPVSSYLAISPLPQRTDAALGRYVSVALSVGLPLPDVIRRLALWSSDFPHPPLSLGARPPVHSVSNTE